MTPSNSEFRAVFRRLKAILEPCDRGMEVTEDTDDAYTLYTRHIMKNSKPLFFGAVTVRKRYVSYHLMPVYVFPALLDDVPPALRQRMQGKSCFNFNRIDEARFGELEELTRRGHDQYRVAGYLTPGS